MKLLPILILLLAFRILLRLLWRKPAASSIPDPTPFMPLKKAEEIVRQLQELGFYKYADPDDLRALTADQAKALSDYGILTTDYKEKTFIPLDYRLYLLDGETLFEQGGFIDAVESMRPLFEKMNFRFDITDHIEEAGGTDGRLNHQVTINGKRYVIFEDFEGYGWGEAAQRFAEIINDQLEAQASDERLYLINSANDGAAIFLTDSQFNLLDHILKDEKWKPLKVADWCRVLEVDTLTATFPASKPKTELI